MRQSWMRTLVQSSRQAQIARCRGCDSFVEDSHSCGIELPQRRERVPDKRHRVDLSEMHHDKLAPAESNPV